MQGLGFGVSGSEFRVQGLESRVHDGIYRVEG